MKQNHTLHDQSQINCEYDYFPKMDWQGHKLKFNS